MKEVTEGSEWIWNSETQPIINDVPVKVVESTEDMIIVEVLDKDLLESDVRSAKKTYTDNGNDIDNVLEVHPFVRWDSNVYEFKTRSRHTILRGYKDRFAENFSEA